MPHTKGENNGRAKLTEADVPQIRQLYVDGMSQANLARQYGVGTTTIHYILTGHNWRHVARDPVTIRERKGETHGCAKLREVDIHQICQLYADGLNVKAIAQRYNVTAENIRRILIGRTWRHVARKPVTIRGNKGENHGRAKLKASDIHEVRHLHAAGMRRSEIARRYGVSDKAIRNILTGHAWRHVPQTPAAARALTPS